jgi:pimeloyl-ACP methyl ester carboxylesterase
MPVTVVAGERDAKFREIGGRIVSSLADGELEVVAGGHNLPLENPLALAAILSRWSGSSG